MVKQYYEKPRTYDEYCMQVWDKHNSANQAVQRRKEEMAKDEIAKFNAKKQGLKAPKREQQLSGPRLYSHLMQDVVYVPKKSSTFNQFYVECESLLSKHSVRLRLPRVFKEDHYDIFAERFAKAMRETVKLPTKASSYFKDVARLLAENAKAITRKTVRNSALSVLRRHLSTHISA